MVRHLAARLRPELEAAVKRNEAPAGSAYIPGDFTQARANPLAMWEERSLETIADIMVLAIRGPA